MLISKGRKYLLLLFSAAIAVFTLCACVEKPEPIVGEWVCLQLSTEGSENLESSDGRFTFEADEDNHAVVSVFGEPFLEGSWFKSDDLSQKESSEAGFDAFVYGVTLEDSLYMAQIFEHEDLWTLGLRGVDSDVEDILFVMIKQSSE